MYKKLIKLKAKILMGEKNRSKHSWHLCFGNKKWNTGFKSSAWMDERPLTSGKKSKRGSNYSVSCKALFSFFCWFGHNPARSIGWWRSRALCIIYIKSLNKKEVLWQSCVCQCAITWTIGGSILSCVFVCIGTKKKTKKQPTSPIEPSKVSLFG